MRGRLASLLALLVTDLSACDGNNRVIVKGTATSDDFCRSLVQNMTALATRCFGGGETYWDKLYSGVLDCNRLAKDIVGGRMAYHQDAAARCLDQIALLPCDGMLEDATDCTGALAGQVSSGGACQSTSLAAFPTCVRGTECSYVAGSCFGTCKPVANAGSACGHSSTGWLDCAEGLTCQAGTGLCALDASEGQPCLGPSASECRSNLVCEDGTSSTQGTCRRRKTAGSCTSAADCASGYVCSGEQGAKSCQRGKLPGDACTPGRGECLAFLLWCGSDGKCTDSGEPENETCGATGGEYVQCAKGLYCAGSTSGGTGICRKETPSGSPCTSSVECSGSASYCDSVTKLCVACS